MCIRDRDFLRFATLIGVEAFNQQHAVEVVHLVLEDAALEFVSLHVDLIAVQVKTGQVDGVGPGDLPTQPGYGKTALIVRPLAVGLDDDRVDDDDGTVALVVDEESLLHADLIGRQTHTRRLVHGLDHRSREGGDAAIDVLYRGRHLVQHRVAVDANGQSTHDSTLPPTRGPPPAPWRSAA